MQVMFEVSTFEMWPDFMYAAINAPSKIDEAPQSWNSPQIAVLFICHIFITGFFILNVFISVIIFQY